MPNPIYPHRDWPREQDAVIDDCGPGTSRPIGFTRAELQQLALRIREATLSASGSLEYDWEIDLPGEDPVTGHAIGSESGDQVGQPFEESDVPTNENEMLPAVEVGFDEWVISVEVDDGESLLQASIRIGLSFVFAAGLYWPTILADFHFELSPDGGVAASIDGEINGDFSGSSGEIDLVWSVFGRSIVTQAGYGGGGGFSSISSVIAGASFTLAGSAFWPYAGTYDAGTGARI